MWNIYVELEPGVDLEFELTGEICIEKRWIWRDRRNYVELGGRRDSERSS